MSEDCHGPDWDHLNATDTAKPPSTALTYQDGAHTLTVLDVIAQAARDPQTDPAKFVLLFELKERVERASAEKAFNVAMSAAQEGMTPVVKDAENPHTHSRYARLESIDKAIRPVYTKHGFALSFNSAPPAVPENVRVLCEVRHAAGFTKAYELEGALDDSGAKGGATKTGIQGLGSSVSYLRRYLTCMIFNITLSGEDNDGNSWEAGKKRAAEMAEKKIEDLKAGKPYTGPEPPLEETLEASSDKAKVDKAKRSPFFKLLDSFEELHEGYSKIKADAAYYATLRRFGVEKSNQFKNTAEGFNAARACYKAMGKELSAFKEAAQNPYQDWDLVPDTLIDSGQPICVAGVLHIFNEETSNYRALNSIPSAS